MENPRDPTRSMYDTKAFFFNLIGLYRDVDKVEIWNENVLQTLKYLKATVSTYLSTYLSVKVVFEVNGANLHG